MWEVPPHHGKAEIFGVAIPSGEAEAKGAETQVTAAKSCSTSHSGWYRKEVTLGGVFTQVQSVVAN